MTLTNRFLDAFLGCRYSSNTKSVEKKNANGSQTNTLSLTNTCIFCGKSDKKEHTWNDIRRNK